MQKEKMSYTGICISGKMGSGKDYLCEKIVGYAPAEFVNMKLADPVYQIAKQDCGMKDKDRILLQTIGTEIGRDIDSDLWIKLFKARMQARTFAKITSIPIVTDCRFQNEYFTLKNIGFYMIRIIADVDIRKQRCGEQYSNPNHPSEIGLDIIPDTEFARTVFNNPGSDGVYTAAREIAQIFGVL